MPITIPPIATTDTDKLKFYYRVGELLRLEHNAKGKDFRDGKINEKEFREYQQKDFEPRSQKLFIEINNLKEKSDLSINYGDIRTPSANMTTAKQIAETGKTATLFDPYINLKEI